MIGLGVAAALRLGSLPACAQPTAGQYAIVADFSKSAPDGDVEHLTYQVAVDFHEQPGSFGNTWHDCFAAWQQGSASGEADGGVEGAPPECLDPGARGASAGEGEAPSVEHAAVGLCCPLHFTSSEYGKDLTVSLLASSEDGKTVYAGQLSSLGEHSADDCPTEPEQLRLEPGQTSMWRVCLSGRTAGSAGVVIGDGWNCDPARFADEANMSRCRVLQFEPGEAFAARVTDGTGSVLLRFGDHFDELACKRALGEQEADACSRATPVEPDDSQPAQPSPRYRWNYELCPLSVGADAASDLHACEPSGNRQLQVQFIQSPGVALPPHQVTVVYDARPPEPVASSVVAGGRRFASGRLPDRDPGGRLQMKTPRDPDSQQGLTLQFDLPPEARVAGAHLELVRSDASGAVGSCVAAVEPALAWPVRVVLASPPNEASSENFECESAQSGEGWNCTVKFDWQPGEVTEGQYCLRLRWDARLGYQNEFTDLDVDLGVELPPVLEPALSFELERAPWGTSGEGKPYWRIRVERTPNAARTSVSGAFTQPMTLVARRRDSEGRLGERLKLLGDGPVSESVALPDAGEAATLNLVTDPWPDEIVVQAVSLWDSLSAPVAVTQTAWRARVDQESHRAYQWGWAPAALFADLPSFAGVPDDGPSCAQSGGGLNPVCLDAASLSEDDGSRAETQSRVHWRQASVGFKSEILPDGRGRVGLDSVPFPRRQEHAMAFDPRRGRVVLYGGASPIARDDTWEWDGRAWQQMPVQDLWPRERSGHAMVYDEVRQVVVLYGGEGEQDDAVWTWNGAMWQRLVTVGPSPAKDPTGSILPLMDHAMAYDPERRAVVLFGGLRDGSAHGETWLLPSDSPAPRWVKLDSTRAPHPRAGHSMAYLAPTGPQWPGGVLLVGGDDGSEGQLSETWRLGADGWHELRPLPSSLNPARSQAVLVPTGTGLLLFGGSCLASDVCPNAAELRTGLLWSCREEGCRWGVDPSERPASLDKPEAAAAAPDAFGRILVFGGRLPEADIGTGDHELGQLRDAAGWRPWPAALLPPAFGEDRRVSVVAIPGERALLVASPPLEASADWPTPVPVCGPAPGQALSTWVRSEGKGWCPLPLAEPPQQAVQAPAVCVPERIPEDLDATKAVYHPTRGEVLFLGRRRQGDEVRVDTWVLSVPPAGTEPVAPASWLNCNGQNTGASPPADGFSRSLLAFDPSVRCGAQTGAPVLLIPAADSDRGHQVMCWAGAEGGGWLELGAIDGMPGESTTAFSCGESEQGCLLIWNSELWTGRMGARWTKRVVPAELADLQRDDASLAVVDPPGVRTWLQFFGSTALSFGSGRHHWRWLLPGEGDALAEDRSPLPYRGVPPERKRQSILSWPDAGGGVQARGLLFGGTDTRTDGTLADTWSWSLERPSHVFSFDVRRLVSFNGGVPRARPTAGEFVFCAPAASIVERWNGRAWQPVRARAEAAADDCAGPGWRWPLEATELLPALRFGRMFLRAIPETEESQKTDYVELRIRYAQD